MTDYIELKKFAVAGLKKEIKNAKNSPTVRGRCLRRLIAVGEDMTREKKYLVAKFKELTENDAETDKVKLSALRELIRIEPQEREYVLAGLKELVESNATSDKVKLSAVSLVMKHVKKIEKYLQRI